MKKLVLLGLLLYPFHAQAQEATVTQLCQQLENYQPGADVEYKPGQNARGDAVAPADLNENGQVPIGDNFRLGITYDQAQQFNLPNVPYSPFLYVGDAEIKKRRQRLFQRQTPEPTASAVFMRPKSKRYTAGATKTRPPSA